jgi:uracil-DNA glycosylase family 4
MTSHKEDGGFEDAAAQMAFDFKGEAQGQSKAPSEKNDTASPTRGFSLSSLGIEALSIKDLKQEALGCRKCHLRDGCRGVVFGEGDPKSLLMFVGEGPGSAEDELGRPFVGAAGQLLDKILTAAGFRREDVYITNVVKCRPPGNRVPTPAEAAACYPYLKSEIDFVNPRILVCLGATALRTLVDPAARITRIRGTWFDKGRMKVIATYHPAALLRDPKKKRPVWEDFIEIRRRYDKIMGTPGNQKERETAT